MSGTLRTRLQTSRVFLISGLSGGERKKYGKIIQQLGGIYFDIDSFKASCTHVICGKLSRSEKYLGACATGRWILRPEYITASDLVKEWLPEEDFEWQPKHGQKSQSDPLVLAPIRWRLHISLTGAPAFKGWNVSVVVSDKKRGHVYKRLLKSGGADVYSVKLPVDNPSKIANTITYMFTDGKMAVQLYNQSLMEYGVLLVKPDFIGDYLLQDPRPDPMDYLASMAPSSKSPGDQTFITSSQKSLSQSSQVSQTLKSQHTLVSQFSDSMDGTFISQNSSQADAETLSSTQGSRSSSLRSSKRFSEMFSNDKEPDSSFEILSRSNIPRRSFLSSGGLKSSASSSEMKNKKMKVMENVQTRRSSRNNRENVTELQEGQFLCLPGISAHSNTTEIPDSGSQIVSIRRSGAKLQESLTGKKTKRLSRSASNIIKQRQNVGHLSPSQDSRSQSTSVTPDADTEDFVMEEGHTSFQTASAGSAVSSQRRQRMSRRLAGVEKRYQVIGQGKELSQWSKNTKREISDPDHLTSLKIRLQSQPSLTTFVKNHHNCLSEKKSLETCVSVEMDIDISSSQEGRKSARLAQFKGVQDSGPSSTALVKRRANNQTSSLDSSSMSGDLQEPGRSLRRAARLTTSNSDLVVKENKYQHIKCNSKKPQTEPLPSMASSEPVVGQQNECYLQKPKTEPLHSVMSRTPVVVLDAKVIIGQQKKCNSEKLETEAVPPMMSSSPVLVSDSSPCPRVRSGSLKAVRSKGAFVRGSLKGKSASDVLAVRTRSASIASFPGSISSCISARQTPDLKMVIEVKNDSQKKFSQSCMSSFASSPLSQGSTRKVSQSSLGDFGFSSTSKQRHRTTLSRSLRRSVSSSQEKCSQPELVGEMKLSTYFSPPKEAGEVVPDNRKQVQSDIDEKPHKIHVKEKTSVTPPNPLMQSCPVKRKIFDDDVDDACDGVQPLTKKMKLTHPVQPWCPLWSGVKLDSQMSKSCDYTLPSQMPSSVSNIINICVEENFQLEALTMTQASIQTYPSSQLLHTLMTQVLLKAKSRHISQMAYKILMNILTAHPPNSKLMRNIYLNAFHLLEDGHREGVWEFISFVIGGALEKDVYSDNYHLLLQFLVAVFRHSFCSFLSEQQSSEVKERRKLLRCCMLVQCLWYPSYLLFPNTRTQQLLDFVEQCLQLPSDCTNKSQLLESILSLVSMATQCCQIADQGVMTNGYPDIGERTSLLINELARKITGCSIKEETTLLATFRNLQPNWLCLRVIQLLLANMDDYLLVKGLDLDRLNLTKIVSQYIFLLPRLSSTKIATKDSHKKQLRKHGRCQESEKDGERDGDGEGITQHMAARINKTNTKGETALHLACMKNHIAKLKQLLAVPGVDVNAPDHAGWTPLHEACNKGHVECVDLLLKYVPARTMDSYLSKNQPCKKADLLACTPDGITPLHDAVASNRLDVCRLLLTHGGSSLLSAMTSRGQCPSDLARTPSMRTLLTTLPTPTKHRGMDFNSSQESQDSPRPHKTDFMPAAFLYQQVLGEEDNMVMADVTDCRLYITLVTHLILSYIHASRLLSRHQTHMQQTHTQQTHTQQTHVQQIRPVSSHTVKVVPETAVKENQHPGRASTRLRKQPTKFDSYDFGKRKVLQEDLTNTETAAHVDESRWISLENHDAKPNSRLEHADEEDDLYIFQRIKCHLRNFTHHISNITSPGAFKLLESKLSVMMFYIVAASSKK
ncbi:LOW QUALITY PROTEIN: uncharacterized protein LOC124285806 [Haliotis rubra]|uniref:LOW QUALITY PROTEIN: uncharacterized protein LOC124285806 n=1 Tax=Haliotis rubra TaxID=36100 RepID=UPI001EE50970|nr:LOW QUALITY PROTEIN: uncharacterized protein LOC124285806 [Haliotis rubra]